MTVWGTNYGPRFWRRPRRTSETACGCIISLETGRTIRACPTHGAEGRRIALRLVHSRRLYDFEEERYV